MMYRYARPALLALALLLVVRCGSAVSQDGPELPTPAERITALDSSLEGLRTWLSAGAQPDNELERSATAYLGEMRDLLIAPVCTLLQNQLRARSMPQTVEEFETLCMRLQSYRVLTGLLEPDSQVISRALSDHLTQIITGGSDPNDRQADQIESHLNLIADLLAGAPQIVRAVNPGGRVDAAAMYRAELTLRADTWAQLAWRQLIDKLTPAVGEIDVDRLLDGMPGAELFAGDRAFSALLTQEGYDKTLRPAIDNAAADILTRIDAAGVRNNRMTLESLIDVFRALFSAEVRGGWNQLILGIHVVPPGTSLDDAFALITRLSDVRTSPLRSLLWTIWESRTVQIEGDQRFSVLPDGDPGQWIPATIDLLDTVRVALAHAMQDAPPVGQRIREWLRSGELERLAAALERAEDSVQGAVRAADRAYVQPLHSMILRLLEVPADALQREAAEELDAVWKHDVVTRANALADCYPFRADSTTDAPWEDVISLWHPDTGHVARLLELAYELQTILQAPLGPGVQAARVMLQRMRHLLFGDDNVPGISILVEIYDLPPGDEVWTEFSAYKVDLARLAADFTGTRRLRLMWTPATPEPAGIRLVKDGVTYSVAGKGPWAFLRLFGAATRERISNVRTQFGFRLLKPGGNDTESVDFVMVCVRSVSRTDPLDPAGFGGISLLDRLTAPTSDD